MLKKDLLHLVRHINKQLKLPTEPLIAPNQYAKGHLWCYEIGKSHKFALEKITTSTGRTQKLFEGNSIKMYHFIIDYRNRLMGEFSDPFDIPVID